MKYFKKHIKYFFTVVAISFLVGFVGLNLVFANHNEDKVNLCHKTHSETNPFVVQSVNANEVESHLGNGDFYYTGEFGIHTDEAKLWCATHQPEEPTATPTDTPEATPSAEPTVEPCSDNCGQQPTFAGSSTDAPAAATCNIPFDKPLLNGFKVEGNGSVTFSWFDVQSVDKFSIIYGYSPDQLIYGADNIPSDSRAFTINGLEAGKNVWAIVGAWRNGCEEESNILDPIIK